MLQPPGALTLAGFELLDGASLRRVGLLDADPALFPWRQGTFAYANLALVGAGRGAPPRLAVADHLLHPPTTAVTCLDAAASLDTPPSSPAGPAAPAVPTPPAHMPAALGRVTGRDTGGETVPCPFRERVWAAGDGSLFALATVCRVKSSTSALRLYRIDQQGRVTHFDLPFVDYEPPVAVAPDGTRVYLADPRHQRLYALAAASGQVLWQQPYGEPHPTPYGHKRTFAPNQIEFSPDGALLYVISNAAPEPGRGVWVVEAHTGHVAAHLAPEVRVAGIAVGPAGDLFLVSPDDGGRLWVVPQGDPHRQTLLRDDLGERLSGVLVGK